MVYHCNNCGKEMKEFGESCSKKCEGEEYLSNIRYFWQEKGDIERFCDFDIKKLEEYCPELAEAYKQYKNYEKIVETLLNNHG